MPPLLRNPRPLVLTDSREVIFYELNRCHVVLCNDDGTIAHSDLYHPPVQFTY
jgi:hypothetical protein